MRVRFFASEKDREQSLARAVAGGVAKGDSCEIVPTCATPDLSNIHVACMVGVKSRKTFDACRRAGVVPVIFDKGYIRTRREDSRVWEWWRVSVGDHHPTRFLTPTYPRDRWKALDITLPRWRGSGLQIVIAGSSAKYHDFYGLPDPTTWATDVVRQLQALSDRPIVYRPKPSWDGAVPIPGTYFSSGRDPLSMNLNNAWAIVTHGSNACFEGMINGIPSIVLGNAVAKPISSTDLRDINDPLLGEREQVLNGLAYWQWTEREMARGSMWKFLRPKIEQVLGEIR